MRGPELAVGRVRWCRVAIIPRVLANRCLLARVEPGWAIRARAWGPGGPWPLEGGAAGRAELRVHAAHGAAGPAPLPRLVRHYRRRRWLSGRWEGGGRWIPTLARWRGSAGRLVVGRRIVSRQVRGPRWASDELHEPDDEEDRTENREPAANHGCSREDRTEPKDRHHNSSDDLRRPVPARHSWAPPPLAGIGALRTRAFPSCLGGREGRPPSLSTQRAHLSFRASVEVRVDLRGGPPTSEGPHARARISSAISRAAFPGSLAS